MGNKGGLGCIDRPEWYLPQVGRLIFVYALAQHLRLPIRLTCYPVAGMISSSWCAPGKTQRLMLASSWV